MQTKLVKYTVKSTKDAPKLLVSRKNKVRNQKKKKKKKNSKIKMYWTDI
jgi:hypothetical protein